MELAPVILFVYNRPKHTEQTLQALASNDFAQNSILYIYADGPKENATENDKLKIAETRAVLQKKNGVKKFLLVSRNLIWVLKNQL